MSEIPDMDAPVTRRELHKALDIWGGALRADITRDVVTQVKALLKILEDRLMTELRSQTRGSADEVDTKLAAIDDNYKDLPRRVTRLEKMVFGPSAPKGRRRAR